jgi:hypothetical protein
MVANLTTNAWRNSAKNLAPLAVWIEGRPAVHHAGDAIRTEIRHALAATARRAEAMMLGISPYFLGRNTSESGPKTTNETNERC